MRGAFKCQKEKWQLLLTGMALFSLLLGGCATVKTLPSLHVSGNPKILSGTRLNLRTLLGKKDRISEKFGIVPPKFPLLDLPFSLVADLVLSPALTPRATYEWLFER